MLLMQQQELSGAVSSIIPIANIIEYWNMNGNSNGYNGHNGVDTLMSYPSGFIDKVADFSASTSSEISVPNNPVFSFGNGVTDQPFSISCWVKLNSTTPSGQFLISKVTGAGNEWRLNYESGNRFTCYLFNNGSSTNQKRGWKIFSPATDTWYHVVMTYDGINFPLIYINNDASSPLTLTVGTYVAMNHFEVPVTIGKATFSTSLSLNGVLDEVLISNIELSASQVSDLYNAGLAGTPIIS